MNATLLNVIAARIEGIFPGEAANLRSIAIEHKRLAGFADETVAEAYDKEMQENEQYLAQRAEKKRRRKATQNSRHAMECMDRLEHTISKGILLADQNTSIDLERICAEWAMVNNNSRRTNNA